MRMLTEAETRERLRQAVEAAGGVRAYSRLHDLCGPGNLSCAIKGTRPISDAIARTIGLTRVIRYGTLTAVAKEAA